MSPVEIIGLAASAIVLLSMSFKTTHKGVIWMRILNSIGCITFFIYGICLGSFTILLLNSITFIVDIYHLIRLLEQRRTKEKVKEELILDPWVSQSDELKYGCFGIDWQGPAGVGRWEIVFDKNGVGHIYSGHMDSQQDKKFSKELLLNMLDKAIVEE